MTCGKPMHTFLFGTLLLILSCTASTTVAKENAYGISGSGCERKTVPITLQCPGKDCPGAKPDEAKKCLDAHLETGKEAAKMEKRERPVKESREKPDKQPQGK